ncbi:hypothetical protein ACFOFO_02095 [Undibacterium arcticum]|uniref:3-keto-disaccharide hydrolase domain-containing protein n=1 Tax=Undibacterium arcticum TaxID=1762892 RepID=A0ABV7EVF7_9BURK
MKPTLVAASLFAVATCALSETVNFDTDAVGHAPSGWTCGTTGKGLFRWTVETDASAPSRPNVLKQSGIATFPWCVKNDIAIADGMVEVKFKPISGKEDQAGGVVWRWKDGNNYYVARANALEGNVSLYHTTNGSRQTIEYKDAPVAPAVWHTLRVEFKGSAIQVSLDGKTYINVNDSHIAGAGKAGVWTKADSVTLFDDFTYATASGK